MDVYLDQREEPRANVIERRDITLQYDAGRRLAIAAAPYSPTCDPGGVFAEQLRQIAELLRAGRLSSDEAFERTLWACAAWAHVAKKSPSVIDVRAESSEYPLGF